MIATNTQTKLKRIEDLTLCEFDRVYSLMRVGEWSDSEIGRVYRLSKSDVRTVFDNYLRIREELEKRPLHDTLPQTPEREPTTKKPRKRRCDAVYATAKERQVAYRARLKESRLAVIEQLSPAGDTDETGPTHEELAVTVCQDSLAEASREQYDPQQSTIYSSSEECYGTSESIADPVTAEGSSESEPLRVIEK